MFHFIFCLSFSSCDSWQFFLMEAHHSSIWNSDVFKLRERLVVLGQTDWTIRTSRSVTLQWLFWWLEGRRKPEEYQVLLAKCWMWQRKLTESDDGMVMWYKVTRAGTCLVNLSLSLSHWHTHRQKSHCQYSHKLKMTYKSKHSSPAASFP